MANANVNCLYAMRYAPCALRFPHTYYLMTFLLLVGCSSQKPGSLAGLQGVRIHSRAEWNAGQPSDKLIPHQIERITLHHSGVVFKGDKTSPEYLKNLQAWSLAERGWVAIPYHFLIDLQGEIWEGRPIGFRGDTNTEYDPTGHALISVMGNYEEQLISPAQLTSIAKLMAALCKKYQVQPETIKSHKDYVPSTLCPGKDLYRYLQDGNLIDSVKKYLD